MKKWIALVGVAALAACQQAEAPAEEAAVEEAAPAANEGPGTFEVTYADGSVGTVTTTAEGTFTLTRGDQSGAGTVAEVDGKLCFDPEGDDPEQPTTCWTNSEIGEDGTWTSTSDDGETVTVKVAEAATEEAAAE